MALYVIKWQEYSKGQMWDARGRKKKKPNIFLLLNILFVLCLSCPKDFFLSSESQQENNLKMINIDFTEYTTVLLEFFCLQQKVMFVVLERGQLI